MTATTRPGLCLSQDGRNWARVEGEHHSGALFDVGEEEAWDASGVRDPKVLLAGPNDIRVYYGSVDAKTGGRPSARRRRATDSRTSNAGREKFSARDRKDRSMTPAWRHRASSVSEGRNSSCFTRRIRPRIRASPPSRSPRPRTDSSGADRTPPRSPRANPGRGTKAASVVRRRAHGGRARASVLRGRAAPGDARGVGVGVAVSAEHDRFAFIRRHQRVTED